MPEYLAPGVYVEETSFRAKSIEGVSTSTAGFVGPARYGPIDGLPELITSFQEFERVFGGSERLDFFDQDELTHNYLAHAVRAFFDNGGRRVYISRIYQLPDEPAEGSPLEEEINAIREAGGRASFEHDSGVALRARYPGTAGECRVAFTFRVGENVLSVHRDEPDDTGYNVLRGINADDLVWIADEAASVPEQPSGTFARAERYFDDVVGRSTWRLDTGVEDEEPIEIESLNTVADGRNDIRRVSVSVEVIFVDRLGTILRLDSWENLGFTPDARTSITTIFAAGIPSRTQELRTPIILDTDIDNGPELAQALLDIFGELTAASQPVETNVLAAHGRRFEVPLTAGSDGVRPGSRAYIGSSFDDGRRKSGLMALEDIPDVSIVAAPGYSADGNADDDAVTRTQAVSNALISHAERMQYRIAVLDAANDQGLTDVRAQRAQLDSKHAALYFPWVRVLDPVTEQEIVLPPSGFVSGIYARNDIERGVHKAPANEVVRGALGFEMTLNKSQQDVLNPEGINCFRFLEGRGNRLWGARTISSDPEWKYVNLRRYFAYLERSIERGTQWVVFENNGYTLWANVRRTIEDFLFNEWKQDHLLGEKPEQAYFVRCDRTTMTQNDLDNGRLVCLIGVAPLRPAEFVIFRIGQWTGDRKV
jgi:phage tail sheath protein FI